MTDKDAWLQLSELTAQFTTEKRVRADIEVTALAHKRAVKLTLWADRNPDVDSHYTGSTWRTTGPRNVSTMREVAQALLDACDFVDACNPEWAKGNKNLSERIQNV